MITGVMIYAASSEHGAEWSAVQRGVKSDSRLSWTHASPSSETRLDHSHAIMDAADSVRERHSIGQTSEDVS